MIAFYAERATFLSFAEMDVDCVGEVTKVEEGEVFFMDGLQLKWTVDYWASSKDGVLLGTRWNTETLFNYVDIFIVNFVACRCDIVLVLMNN